MFRRDQAAVWPFAALLALSGVAMLGYAADPHSGDWLERTAVTVCGAAPSAAHALLLGLILLLLAQGLHGRRRAAWGLSLGLVLWSTLVEAQALTVAASGVSWRLIPLVLTTVALLRARDRFTVGPDPHRARQALAVGFTSGVTLLLLGGGGIFAERGRFAAPVSVGGLGREFLAALAADSGPVDFSGPGWLLPGLSVAAGLSLLCVLRTLLTAALPPSPAGPAERAAMRALVAHPQSDSLAPFALRHDKAYVFEPRGRAAIGYRVLAGVAVAGGDPVGERAAWPDAIDAFLARAARQGWRPAVLGAGPAARPLWAARRLRGISIGDEVMVDVAGFSLTGRAMRNVRQAVRRTERAGISVSVLRERDLDAEVAAQLRRIHLAWLGQGPGPRRRGADGRERGFAMNLDAMAEGSHPDAILAIAYAADGYAVSFQRYLPAAAAGPRPVLSLDVMPRDLVAPNGVNERLIVAVIEYAHAHAYAAVSLNFAAFRTLLEAHRSAAATPGRLSRGARRAVHVLDPLIQVESLYRFNAKFQPHWVPRAVMIASWLDLPRFAIAVLGLEFALPYDRHRSRPLPLSAADPALWPGPQGADQPNWSAVQRHSSRSGSPR